MGKIRRGALSGVHWLSASRALSSASNRPADISYSFPHASGTPGPACRRHRDAAEHQRSLYYYSYAAHRAARSNEALLPSPAIAWVCRLLGKVRVSAGVPEGGCRLEPFRDTMLAPSLSAVGASPAGAVLWLFYAFAFNLPGAESQQSTCLSKPLLPPFNRHGKEPASSDLTYCLGCVLFSLKLTPSTQTRLRLPRSLLSCR